MDLGLSSIVLFDDEQQARDHFRDVCKEKSELHPEDWEDANDCLLLEGYVFIEKCQKAVDKS